MGGAMTGYCRMRDDLKSEAVHYERLDAAQLVKHAFGLRTTVHRKGGLAGKKPVLVYLFAEPDSWPDGRAVPGEHLETHRREIADFGNRVAGDQVQFVSFSYGEMLNAWRNSRNVAAKSHADAVAEAFAL
jgi:hypothetical protein